MGAGNCGDQGEWPCSAIIQPNSHQLCTNCITNCTQTVSLASPIHPPSSKIVHQVFTNYITNCISTVSPSPHQLYHQMYTTSSPTILPTSPVVHQLYSNCITSFTNYTSIVLQLYHQLMYYNCTPNVHHFLANNISISTSCTSILL